MFIGRTRKHDVQLIGISDVQGPWVAHHFSHSRPDNHDVRPGLYPMLVRVPLVRIVVGGAGISGQHVDEAHLVWRLGFRTAREIDNERFALKTLRGDFRNVPTESQDRPLDVSEALAAVDT